jgi:hypothetical protein
MFISGSQLQTINSQALQSALSQIGEWMGKAVHWIQIKSTSLAFPEIHLQSKWGAVLTIAAADLLIYQLAYRIANLLDPEHNYIEARPGHFSMQLGALFAIGYGACHSLSRQFNIIFLLPSKIIVSHNRPVAFVNSECGSSFSSFIVFIVISFLRYKLCQRSFLHMNLSRYSNGLRFEFFSRRL